MKYNLRDSLQEMGLINEGWYNDLQDKYDIENLNFVKEEIKRIYSLNNFTSKSTVENNPLGEWMVKVVNSMGGLQNLGSKELNSARHAFETILKFFILTKEDEKVKNNITSKKPEEAYKLAKEEIEKLDKQFTIPDEIQEFINSGLIKLVPNGKVDDQRFWVEVLDRNFFDKMCSSGSKFGIVCQQGGQTGGKYVGGIYATYTLLGTEKNSNIQSYSTLMSLAANLEEDKIIELKQIGNQQPGSTPARGWKDLGKVAVDFLINNPKGKPLVKFVDFFSMEIPSNSSKYGGAGTLSYWMERQPSLFEDLVSAKPNIIDYHENLIINVLGREYLEDLDVDLDTLYKENPKRFISRIGIYLGNSPDEVLDILKNKFNFEEFINNYGESEIFSVLPTIIKLLDFKQFLETIYPYINFDNFIRNSSEAKIREVIKEFRNKENSPKKAFKIIDYIFDNHRDTLLEKFGGKSKGLAKIINLFNTPRLEKHQNYQKKSGTKDIYATVLEPQRDEDGRVLEDPDNPGNPIMVPKDKLVQPENLILDPKNIRNFLNNNKEYIFSLFNGTEEEKEIMFSKYIMANSNEQERNKILSNFRDRYIEYYDEKYKNKISPLPGVLQYTRDKEQFYTLKESSLKNKFDTNEKIYKFDKEDLKNNKYLSDLLKYYIQKSNASGMERLADAIGIILEQMKEANFSVEELSKLAFDSMSPEKVLKKSPIKPSIYSRYINNLLEISEHTELSREDIMDYAKSDKVREAFEQSKKSTSDIIYKSLLSKINPNIQESKVRLYVRNLLESNYKKKA